MASHVRVVKVNAVGDHHAITSTKPLECGSIGYRCRTINVGGAAVKVRDGTVIPT